MPNPKYAAYEPAGPYFELVRGALGDLVDGEHFFGIVTDDVVFEVLLQRDNQDDGPATIRMTQRRRWGDEGRA